jgi:hypothetical protein
MTTRKSNRGIPVDLDALISTSSQSPAVGNMRVNAVGDVLGTGGVVMQKNEDRVRAYYKNNPRSSTAQTSLKGDMPRLSPDQEPKIVPKTTATAIKTAKSTKNAPATRSQPVEPDEFSSPQEPQGYREVELPNGDIEMVPVYKND